MTNTQSSLDLTPLIKEQIKLDEYIKEHHPEAFIDQSYRLTNLKLALCVELGEFANTTRCFKIWSNKGMEEKSVMLDEYVDMVHFLLVFTYSAGLNNLSIAIEEVKDHSLTELLLRLNRAYLDIDVDSLDITHLLYCWSLLARVASFMGFTSDDISSAYMKKNKVNIERQDNNY